MQKITVVPVGGLANRMKAVAGGIALSQELQSLLSIVWFRDWALPCRFDELFESINIPHVTIKEASTFDHLLLDRPRAKNLNIPRIFQKIMFDDILYEQEVLSLYRQKFDFKAWAENKRVYLSSYFCFFDCPQAIYRKLFVPTKLLREAIDKRCNDFGEYTVGLHIRRSDNEVSIKNSPISLFHEKIEQEIELNDNVLFYLATDSEHDRNELQHRYGKRMLVSENPPSRDNAQGIKDAVVELYLLSKTNKIYGSFGSTFSEMAAWLGGKEPIILQK